MNLIETANTFLNQVNHFYINHDAGNAYKFTLIERARAEIKVIETCPDCEHPLKFLSIRRLLVNTLPHFGYDERGDLDITLNFILDTCRERLK